MARRRLGRRAGAARAGGAAAARGRRRPRRSRRGLVVARLRRLQLTSPVRPDGARGRAGAPYAALAGLSSGPTGHARDGPRVWHRARHGGAADARCALRAQPSPVDHVSRAVLLAMSDRIDEARSTRRRRRGPPSRARLPAQMPLQLWGHRAARRRQRSRRRAAPSLRRLRRETGWHGTPVQPGTDARARRSARSAATTKQSHSRSRDASSATEDDLITQTVWRQVAALVAANRGEHAEAERLAREAVSTPGETDALPLARPTRSATSPRCSKPPTDTTKPPPPTEQALDRLRTQTDHPARPPHPRTPRRAPSSDGLRHKADAAYRT